MIQYKVMEHDYVSQWLTVLRSLRRNVRTAKSLTAKCPYGEVSLRQSVLTAKCPHDEMSLRQSVHTAKCPYGEMSYGELSYGKKSYGEKSGQGLGWVESGRVGSGPAGPGQWCSRYLTIATNPLSVATEKTGSGTWYQAVEASQGMLSHLIRLLYDE